MIAMRYGTLPLVRETGGLHDTVVAYNSETGDGNGFSFANYDAGDMLHVLRQALELYRSNPEAWRVLQKNGMTADWSWAGPASHYIKLYNKITKD
jgi:starch synthase